MTKQEFTERTKMDISNEDYAVVERIYMAAGDIDKDNFCRLFKNINTNGHNLAVWLMEAVERKETCIKQLREDLDTRDGEQREVAEFLIGKASAYNDTDSYMVAVTLIGQKQLHCIKSRTISRSGTKI